MVSQRWRITLVTSLKIQYVLNLMTCFVLLQLTSTPVVHMDLELATKVYNTGTQIMTAILVQTTALSSVTGLRMKCTAPMHQSMDAMARVLA